MSADSVYFVSSKIFNGYGALSCENNHEVVITLPSVPSCRIIYFFTCHIDRFTLFNGLATSANFIWSTPAAAASAPTYDMIYFFCTVTVAQATNVTVSFACDDVATLLVNGQPLTGAVSNSLSVLQSVSTTLKVSLSMLLSPSRHYHLAATKAFLYLDCRRATM